jgi:hypothetical protein
VAGGGGGVAGLPSAGIQGAAKYAIKRIFLNELNGKVLFYLTNKFQIIFA